MKLPFALSVLAKKLSGVARLNGTGVSMYFNSSLRSNPRPSLLALMRSWNAKFDCNLYSINLLVDVFTLATLLASFIVFSFNFGILSKKLMFLTRRSLMKASFAFFPASSACITSRFISLLTDDPDEMITSWSWGKSSLNGFIKLSIVSIVFLTAFSLFEISVGRRSLWVVIESSDYFIPAISKVVVKYFDLSCVVIIQDW